MTNYIKFKFFNKNNNKVQIKDVFFLNKTVNKPEMSDSLLFVFEKVIEVIGDRLCIGIESQKKKKKKEELFVKVIMKHGNLLLNIGIVLNIL